MQAQVMQTRHDANILSIFAEIGEDQTRIGGI
jgi:hypothetical protein